MTYREFLLAVLVPLLVAAAGLLVRRYRSAGAAARRRVRRGGVLVAVLAVVAMVYTMPWDRWLIQHAVWWYPKDSVLGTIGLVPIEEYLFMIGQTLITGCWVLSVASRGEPVLSVPSGRWRRPVAASGWLLVSALGVLLCLHPHTLYAGAILVWFGPLLAVQSGVGADVLRAARPVRLLALATTVLLWIADDIGIRTGAWRLGAAHTIGLRPWGLPVEEALFFVATNLLIVDSVLLLDSPVVWRRLRPPANTKELPCTRSTARPTMW